MAKVKASGLFLINKYDMILIGHPTRHAIDSWSIPKGKIEEGETALNAAIRETFEETNVDASVWSVVQYLNPVNYKHGKKILHPFLIQEAFNPHLKWDSFELKCNSNVPEDRGGFPEMDDFKWVTLDEARLLLHDTQVACFEEIVKIINVKARD